MRAKGILILIQAAETTYASPQINFPTVYRGVIIQKAKKVTQEVDNTSASLAQLIQVA